MSITDLRKQNKTARQIEHALRKDPNDIEALLQRAAMLGGSTKPDVEQERTVLYHILTLDPSNREARAMLFELDRAEIGGHLARLSLAVILTDPSTRRLPEPPLVLRYSIVHRLIVYLFMGITLLIALLSIGDPQSLVRFGALLVFLLLPLWYVSAVIEISDTGLKVSRLFGLSRVEIAWSEVREVKRTVFGQGLRMIHRSWKVLELSSQIQGYPFILDILGQRRPDLFSAEESANAALS
jgi:hypothetical protein